MDYMTDLQFCKIKSFIVNTNNHLNEIYSSFNKLHKELSPGFYLIDNFPNHFSFHIINCKDKDIFNDQICSLDKLIDNFSSNPEYILVIADASIKNNVNTSILHICFSCNILAKTIHHITDITSTKAKLFSIRYGINQAI